MVGALTNATRKAALTMIACFYTRAVPTLSGFVASAAGHSFQLEHTSEKELPEWWVFKLQALSVVQELGTKSDLPSVLTQCLLRFHSCVNLVTAIVMQLHVQLLTATYPRASLHNNAHPHILKVKFTSHF